MPLSGSEIPNVVFDVAKERGQGGETSIVDYCDEDIWSRFEAMEIVVEQGYVAENITGGEWLAIYAGRDKYEVSSSQGNRDKFVVDLKLHEYSCRKFQLTGYPCEYAMSCIKKMCLDVKNYVNQCYKKETYVDCYQHVIYLLNGLNL
ncbi:hypothetical protein Ahy_B06g081414 [Arachis hypogaea]|uniref:Zinc finger PMZ-type domain-containing protein n=1 Tax=Arachis hypogaea TaxID=3818 RepID=A0A444YL28_ARAHY|nr:hypothetical protein Ahy_B06g081414 [Arachis hypogaea]